MIRRPPTPPLFPYTTLFRSNRPRALAGRLGERGIGLLDAPVSGGVKRAIAGTLSIMVGGDADLLAQHLPLLQRMGQAITHVGPVGAGHALKALNNYVSAAALIARSEEHTSELQSQSNLV